jgi:hypothetical protein
MDGKREREADRHTHRHTDINGRIDRHRQTDE